MNPDKKRLALAKGIAYKHFAEECKKENWDCLASDIADWVIDALVEALDNND